MKAFVIKNIEGQYLDNCQDFETTNICDARLFDDYKEALSFRPKDCELVEIILVEGNLLQKIGELKDYIYSYNNEINHRPQVCNEYIDATCSDILEKMKELKL